jgi:hypothetical protein
MIVDMVPPWGTKVHYMSGIHTNVIAVQLPSGQAWYSYLRDKPGTVTFGPGRFFGQRCRSISQQQRRKRGPTSGGLQFYERNERPSHRQQPFDDSRRGSGD